MKPVREPTSSRPKPCASVRMPHESGPFASPSWPSWEENRRWSEISFHITNLPVCAFDAPAQGFDTPLDRQRSSYPPPSPNLERTQPIKRYQALSNSAPCLSRAATSRRATNWNSEEAHTWEHNLQPTIIPPPRLSRPAGSRIQPVGCISRGRARPYTRRPLHSYPKTRFRRERTRGFLPGISTRHVTIKFT